MIILVICSVVKCLFVRLKYQDMYNLLLLPHWRVGCRELYSSSPPHLVRHVFKHCHSVTKFF